MYKLRELTREDISTINSWRNDAELISKLGAPFRYINNEVDVEWYSNYMRSRGNTVRCAIVKEDNNQDILGLISLTDINYINRCAQLHIMIGCPDNRAKGMGTFAINEMINHAFTNLNLHRLELNVLEDNSIAIHVYEKCGFKREGIKRQANYKQGRYKDVIMMGLIREDK